MPPLGSVIGQRERRTIHLLGERVDAKQRTVPASLSSENPVLRFWGREILSHAPGAVDLSRATPSLPLLASHNADELPPIGRVENVHLDGKKLRGVLRFARTARGDELLQAVEDGDLRSLSIGYSIDEVEQAEKGADGIPTFRVTKWTLLEASLANVPADASVGIGRSLAGGKKTMKLKHGQNQEPAGNVSVGEDGAVRKERHRVEEILSIGEKWNCRELAQQYISEGKPLDAFRKALVDELGTRQAPLNPDVPFSSGTPDASLDGGIGLSSRDFRRYSLFGAISALINGDRRSAGYEFEISQALERASNRRSEGLIVPLGVFASRVSPQRQVRQITTTTGAALVGTDHMDSEFVDVLRAASVVAAAGARTLTGLRGNVSIPRKTEAGALLWLDEDDAASEDNSVYDAVTMTPHTVSGLQHWTRRTMLQTSPAIEDLCRQDLLDSVAGEIDRVALNGLTANKEPVGVLNTGGIGDVTTGGALTWQAVTELIGDVASANALTDSCAFICSPGVYAAALRTPKDPGSGAFIWDAQNKIGPHQAFVTSHVPSTLGAGTLSALIFGAWDSLLIGFWSQAEILVDPFTGFTQGRVRVRCMLDCDVAIRHADAFSAAQDIDPTA